MEWRNPLTGGGIALHEFDRLGTAGIQVHECGYLPGGCDWRFDGVCSPFWRLYHNNRPGSHIEIGARKIPLLPNRVLLVPENTTFNCRGGLGVPHLWIHFSLPATLRLVPTQIGLPVDSAARANLAVVRREFRDPVDKRALFHAALALMHGCLARASLHVEGPFPPALNVVLEFIESSLTTPLNNTILARKAGMSLQGFLRWFRDHQGVTPARYVARRRIREACRLLTLTSSSIEVVAEAVGFANRHHFTRVFRQHIGEGPAHFRRGQSMER